MKNYFETFNFPIDFDLDLEILEKKYLEFQNQFHPDKSGLDDISKSIEINEAYKILSDNFLRICHILQLQNIDILSDEKAAKVDFSTLASILELQEKISEIADKNEVKNLEEKLNNEIKFLIASAVKCYKTNDLALATQFLIKVKYLKKSLQDLKIKKQKL